MRASRRVQAGVWALFLVTPLLVGCTGGPPDQVAEPEPLSFREAVEAAQDEVRSWNEDANLVAVSTFEGSEGSPALERRKAQGNGSFPVYADPLPGDGRAPQWVLVWIADDRSRTLRVTSQQTAWLGQGGQPIGAGATPIGEVELDSTDVAQRAAEETEELDRLLGADDVSVFLTLGNGSRGAEWQFRARSHSLQENVALFVDANTGEVMNRTERAQPGQSRTFGGQLDPDHPTQNHTATVDRDPARVAVRLAWNASAAENGTRLKASLFDGDQRLEPAQASRSTTQFQARWDGVSSGNYTVQVAADEFGNATNVSYSLAFHVG